MRGILLVALLSTGALPSGAWAAGTLAIQARDDKGPILTSITIAPDDLTAPSQDPVIVTTDSNGTAIVPLPAGSYRVTTTASSGVRTTQRYTVEDGQTTRAEFSLGGVPAWMARTPPGLGAFTLGVFSSGQWSEPERRNNETTRITVGNNPPMDFANLSRGIDVDWSLYTLALEGGMGLPVANLPDGWFISQIFTGLHVKAGGARAEIDVKAPSGSEFSFDGDGPFAGVGLNATLVACGCGLFFTLGYQFEWSELDLELSDCAGTLPVAACRTRTDGDYHAHIFEATVGHIIWDGRAAFSGGLRYMESVVRLDTTTTLTATTGVNVVNRTKLELEKDGVWGLLVADLRLMDSLFLHGEVAFNDTDVAALVRLVWAIGFARSRL